jgi:paraquat-inducible protein B
MTLEAGDPEGSATALPKPVLRRRWNLSPIWAFPIVAAVIALWLAYTTLAEQGPTVTVTFETAAGLEAGKTRVKHNDVQLGVVERVDLSPDLSRVIVTAKMSKAATPHLREGTRFWVVRPRISVTSFSGLETLISGAYIELDPGDGPAAQTFQGLETPPVVRSSVPGRAYILRAPKLGSVGPGSPIYFRSIRVGEVLGYDFTGIDKEIVIHAFVRAPFDALVYDGTRFWNASGISLSTGPQGFRLQVESLQAVLTGGIAFETPESARAGEPSGEGTSFPLYEDHDSVQDANYTVRGYYTVEFEGSVHGLQVGAPVEFRGVKVGRVTDLRLEFDSRGDVVRLPVTIELERERLQIVGPAAIPQGSQLVAELVARGMRAQLRSANLLTGQMIVALDFFPNAPPGRLVETGGHPAIPTVRGDLETITNSVSGVLDRVAALPLELLAQDVHKTLRSFEALAEMPEITDALKSLVRALAATESLMRNADTQAGPLIGALRNAITVADGTLASLNRGYGGDSQVRRDLADLVRQIQDTARSVKLLADYLEQHPESLVRGKSGAPR